MRQSNFFKETRQSTLVEIREYLEAFVDEAVRQHIVMIDGEWGTGHSCRCLIGEVLFRSIGSMPILFDMDMEDIGASFLGRASSVLGCDSSDVSEIVLGWDRDHGDGKLYELGRDLKLRYEARLLERHGSM